MSPTRIEQPAEPISLDLSAALSLEHGLGRSELLQIGPRLDGVRRQLLADAHCVVRRPKQILDEYQSHRQRSVLGQILAAAKRLRDLVDRAVILGPAPLLEAAHVLFAACCHPHHNDLTRGQRGGRPRIFFAPAAPDNDALQGLLDLLPHGRLLPTIDERWGIVALDDKNCNLVAGLFGLLWDLLQSTVETTAESQYAIAVGSADSLLMQFAEQAGCQRIVDPSELATAAVFRPGVLAAASVMGMDIVKLLRGGAMMAERFDVAPAGDNPALDLAGLSHLLSTKHGIRQMAIESSDAALQPLGQWSARFEQSARHLLIQVIPAALRRDRLRVTMRTEDAPPDDKKRITPYLSELADTRRQSVRNARSAAGEPTAVVRLPLVDESSIGQLVQMFSIARAVQNLLNPEP